MSKVIAICVTSSQTVCLAICPVTTNPAVMKCMVILSLALFARAQPPIPASPPGEEFGESATNATVQLDVYLDPVCPDSRAAWPTMKNVQEHYEGKLRLLVHCFALPYHRNSFLTTQTFYFITKEAGTAKAMKYLDAIFNAYPAFENAKTWNLSDPQVIMSLSSVVQKATSIDGKTFISKISQPDAPSNNLARVAWKYGCTRGVYGTPVFFVNGVMVNGDPEWTVKDWTKILDPLVHAE